MFSIVIPTLQINKKILNMLLAELVSDECIGEIIIIDNSRQGINYHDDKIKVIVPSENIYVNSAWNLGVMQSKYDYVGILNDDLIFPKKFFKSVYNFITTSNKIGYIGLNTIPKAEEKDFIEYPNDTELKFISIQTRPLCWGSAVFFARAKYFVIPEKFKIWCGDDFLFSKSHNYGFTNYAISNSNVKHLHSLTSNSEDFNEIKRQDNIYAYLLGIKKHKNIIHHSLFILKYYILLFKKKIFRGIKN